MPGPPRPPLWQRVFMRAVKRKSGCWEWTGARYSTGYGMIGLGGRGRSPTTTSRAAWTAFYGRIPNGLCVLHSCDNRLCVRPTHLFLGTKKDNSMDMSRKGRWKNQYKD